jgi:glycosyltransferase involved in cell wall biosynthesis
VGDYTWRLAHELASTTSVAIVSDETGQPIDSASVQIRRIPGWGPRGMVHLWRRLREMRPDWINLQYVPFLYSRLGVNPWLPITIVLLRLAGYQILLTVHEPFVPFGSWWRAPIALMQRVILAVLVTASHRVAVSIPTWERMLKRMFFWRDKAVFCLPVGSNIAAIPRTAQERRSQRSDVGIGDDDIVLVAFSPIGSGKLIDWLWRSWEELRDDSRCVLLVIGRTADEVRRVYPAFDDRGGRVICTGYVSPEAVSRYLSCADLFLAPLVDGISSRRTSVIAGLEHGLPVVTTWGPYTEDELFAPDAVLMVPVDQPQAFTSAVRQLAADGARRADLARRGHRLWEERFSWPAIEARLTSVFSVSPNSCAAATTAAARET